MAKNGLKWQKTLSVALHISGTMHHMIIIYVTHVCKDNISRIFLHYFKILIYGVNSVVKGQKMVQNDNNYVCHTPYLRKHTLYILWWFLVHICKMMASPDTLFIFWRFWFYGLLGEGGSKCKKMALNDKKICLTSLSQEPYLIWLWFLVHMCKMMISPAIFFIFSKFWFYHFGF